MTFDDAFSQQQFTNYSDTIHDDFPQERCLSVEQ